MATGAYRLEWNDEECEAIIGAATFEGLQLAAQHLLQVSSELAPIEEGDLARSGEVSDNGDDTVVVSYDRPYAVRQHEELTWRHDPGRQAKYLEQPMHTEKDTMLALIAQAARKEIP